jgi:hypothetical protein
MKKQMLAAGLAIFLAFSSNSIAMEKQQEPVKIMVEGEGIDVTQKFSDLKKTDWCIDTITTLTDKKIINGFQDGTFRPNTTIQVDQFIKMVIIALGYTNIEKIEGYWATPYIEKAIQIGIVEQGQFSNYKRPILRDEIAEMLVKALDEEDRNKKVNEIEKFYLLDIDKIDKDKEPYVTKAFLLGLIGGYPDRTFRAKEKATRAETCTLLCRFLNKVERLNVSELFTNYNELPKHPKFNQKRILTAEDDYRYFTFKDLPIKFGDDQYLFNLDFHNDEKNQYFQARMVIYMEFGLKPYLIDKDHPDLFDEVPTGTVEGKSLMSNIDGWGNVADSKSYMKCKGKDYLKYSKVKFEDTDQICLEFGSKGIPYGLFLVMENTFK